MLLHDAASKFQVSVGDGTMGIGVGYELVLEIKGKRCLPHYWMRVGGDFAVTMLIKEPHRAKACRRCRKPHTTYAMTSGIMCAMNSRREGDQLIESCGTAL